MRVDPGTELVATGGAAAVGAAPIPGTAERRGRSASRDPWLDNIRWLAGVLIVVGHVIASLPQPGFAEQVWAATWAFRVPVFVVVAGWFSSSEPLSPRRATALLRDVLLVYLVCDLLSALQVRALGGESTLDPFIPNFGLWFLLSLVAWRAALPMVAHVPWVGLWAVVVALGAGAFGSVGAAFGVSRTLALFPLFVLGWWLRSSRFAELASWRWKLAAAAGVSLVAAAAMLLRDHLSTSDFMMREPYPVDALPESALKRGLLLAVGAAGAISMLLLVPRRRLPLITALGAGSMFIYVLHLFVVQQLRMSGAFDGVTGTAQVAAVLVLTVVAASMLASRPVRLLTRPLIQPRSWLGRSRRVP